MEYKDIMTVIVKAAEIDRMGDYEWLEDCVEDAEKQTGITISDEYRGRVVRAVELYESGYSKLEEFVKYGVTVK